MSNMTEIVIITLSRDDEAIARVNAAIAEQARGQALEPLGDPKASFGGSKVPGCAIYGACFNYVDWGTLMDALEQARWRFPLDTLAWIESESDPDLQVWRPAGC